MLEHLVRLVHRRSDGAGGSQAADFEGDHRGSGRRGGLEMGNRTYDAVVIGGGPAGYVCCIRLGQLGQRVLCVEKEEVGGVCLNWGCVPSKAIIETSHTFDKIRRGGFGLRVDAPRIDVDE